MIMKFIDSKSIEFFDKYLKNLPFAYHKNFSACPHLKYFDNYVFGNNYFHLNVKRPKNITKIHPILHDIAHLVEFGKEQISTRIKNGKLKFNGKLFHNTKAEEREIRTFAIELHLIEFAENIQLKEMDRIEIFTMVSRTFAPVHNVVTYGETYYRKYKKDSILEEFDAILNNF